MEVSRILTAIFGNVNHRSDGSIKKDKFDTRFYLQPNDEEGEIIFCKNNVCVYSGEKHLPGYMTLKACALDQQHTRLILHWTSNVQLQENVVTEDQRPLRNNQNEQDETFQYVFHIELTEMKTLKFFFQEDDLKSGHFVIGNHENHYKVFHFHHGSLHHLAEIFDNWPLCKRVKLPDEESRKICFSIIPIFYIQPNQSLQESRYSPMTKTRWESFFNQFGQLEDVANFRKEVFFGGILSEVRQEAWTFLLHYYPFHSRTSERKNIKAEKTQEYLELDERRLNMPKQEYDQFWLNVQCTVDKDVVRTDRSHPYFAGNDNPNVEIMRKVLLNYAYYQPEVGYNQGMSDLLASILCTVQDEVDAFWCFVGLMEKSLFVTSPKDDSMDCQLLFLKELLRMMATKFYAHLLLEDEGMDLLFCHRWLLLGFKREFHDMHVMRMWEACWSHYQTEYFHVFLCVAIVLEYGDQVWRRSMRVDEMLNYFNNMAYQMDGDRVLRKARSLLHQFRQLSAIPCTLRGLLSGPGAWDSATLPEIECTCRDSSTCQYSAGQILRKRSFVESQNHSKDEQKDESDFSDTIDDHDEKFKLDDGDIDSPDHLNEEEQRTPEDYVPRNTSPEYETCNESADELALETNESDEVEKREENIDEETETELTTCSKSEQIYDVAKVGLSKDNVKDYNEASDDSQTQLYVSQ